MENPSAKPARPKTLKRWLKSTSNRGFVLYPVLIFLFEWLIHREPFSWWGRNVFLGILFLLWGYGQYRLAGNYRTRIGGGGPGIEVPPERIVDQGIYAYTRNPMYLGIMIFYVGLAITFWSWAALLLLAFHIFWFNQRAAKDEERLIKLFGAPYDDYRHRVKRWIPYVI